MARLILLVERPPHMASEETETWLRGELSTLAGKRGVARVSVARLESVSMNLGRRADWLIELECAGREDAERTTGSSAFTDLFGDLRLIGMHPSVALVDCSLDVPARAES